MLQYCEGERGVQKDLICIMPVIKQMNILFHNDFLPVCACEPHSNPESHCIQQPISANLQSPLEDNTDVNWQASIMLGDMNFKNFRPICYCAQKYCNSFAAQ